MTAMLSFSLEQWPMKLFGLIIFLSLLFFLYQVQLHRLYADTRGFRRIGIAPGLLGQRLKDAQNEFISKSAQLVNDGYAQSKKEFFMVQTADLPRLIVPLHLLDHLKALPETVLSHREALADRFVGRYHGMENLRRSHIHSDVCRLQLVQNLPVLIDPMAIEAETILFGQLPQLDKDNRIDSWSTVPVSSILSQALSAVNGLILGGPEICRNSRWAKVSATYTQSLFMSTAELRTYHPLVRPLVEPFLQSTRNLKQAGIDATKILSPLIEERRRHRKTSPNAGKVNDRSSTRPKDILQWMVDVAEGEDASQYSLTMKMLFIGIVTHSANGAALVQALFDFVAASDDLKTRLIDEAKREFDAAGRKWTFGALNSMRVMDAFLKESQRLNGAALLGFNRKTLQKVDLPDGTTIPSGTIITLPIQSIAHDAEHWSDPEAFRVERHLGETKADRGPTADVPNPRDQFASPDPHVLGFGYGRFACPGRVFVAAQMKLIMATLLLNWEWRWGGETTGRPPNLVFNDMVLPNPNAIVQARHR